MFPITGWSTGAFSMILLVLLCINCNRYIYPCNVLSVDLWPAGLPVSGWLVSIYILSSGGAGGAGHSGHSGGSGIYLGPLVAPSVFSAPSHTQHETLGRSRPPPPPPQPFFSIAGILPRSSSLRDLPGHTQARLPSWRRSPRPPRTP